MAGKYEQKGSKCQAINLINNGLIEAGKSFSGVGIKKRSCLSHTIRWGCRACALVQR